MKSLVSYSTFIIILLLISCKREEPIAKAPINSFSMRVNGQVWTPFQSNDDPCTSTYTSSFAHLGEIPLYTFYAYRDPTGRADAYSENLLRMRVMNVTEPGTYLLNGSYKEDFDSYIIFQIQQSTGNAKRYVNDSRRSPFVVNVQEFIPIKWSSIKGLKGSFSGILYNETDPLDFVTIEKGEFTFNIVGVNFDRHCDL